MKFLYDIFFPKTQGQDFTSERFIREMESGMFRDVFNLGVNDRNGGEWLLKDFSKEPNALYVGAMGSGKSVSASFTTSVWFAANSDQTIMFIIDPMKGANDYIALFPDHPNQKYSQIYPIISDGGIDPAEGIRRVIDLIHSEAMARMELFNKHKATSIRDYESKTGNKMARIVVLFEEFHSIPYAIMEFDKDYKTKNTIANKFHVLMRIGRTMGCWFIAASQKSTKSDIPSEIVPNFTQKQIFKVSQGEANYVLGDSRPSQLNSSQKGRCYTDFGAVQFPYVTVDDQKKLIDKYYRPLEAECAYMTPELVKSYLSGKSSKELYKLKKLSEMAEALGSFDGELILQIMSEKLGCQWEELDSKTDSFGICGIMTMPAGDRRAVVYKADSKISGKDINLLAVGCNEYQCDSGLIFCLGERLSSSLYKSSLNNGIKLFDHEDIIRLARQLDANKINEALNSINRGGISGDGAEEDNKTFVERLAKEDERYENADHISPRVSTQKKTPVNLDRTELIDISTKVHSLKVVPIEQPALVQHFPRSPDKAKQKKKSRAKKDESPFPPRPEPIIRLPIKRINSPAPAPGWSAKIKRFVLPQLRRRKKREPVLDPKLYLTYIEPDFELES